MGELNAELVLYRLNEIEAKLDEVLKEQGSRITSLEHFRTGRKVWDTIFSIGGGGLLSLAIKDFWLSLTGR